MGDGFEAVKSIVGLKNTDNDPINPATEDKQDSIIALLGGAADEYILNYVVKSDDVDVFYLGKAVPATATSAASWQIKRFDYSDGNIAKTLAGGNDNFDNVWDNRESLSYS